MAKIRRFKRVYRSISRKANIQIHEPKRTIKRTRLQKTKSGAIILPNGQRITPEEQRRFKSAVSQANRRRQVIIANLPQEAVSRYSIFGIESDFVARKKSASFGRFRNRNEFLQYFKQVKKVSTFNYLDEIVEKYRKNLNRAIDDVFNSAGKPLKQFIKSLNNEELRQLTLDESFNDIGFVYYEKIAVSQKLEILTKQIEGIRKRK